MIKLEKIEINNFKSIKKTSIDGIDGHGLYIFTGKNGVGKSNVLDAVEIMNKKEWEPTNYEYLDYVNKSFMGKNISIFGYFKDYIEDEMFRVRLDIPEEVKVEDIKKTFKINVLDENYSNSTVHNFINFDDKKIEEGLDKLKICRYIDVNDEYSYLSECKINNGFHSRRKSKIEIVIDKKDLSKLYKKEVEFNIRINMPKGFSFNDDFSDYSYKDFIKYFREKKGTKIYNDLGHLYFKRHMPELESLEGVDIELEGFKIALKEMNFTKCLKSIESNFVFIDEYNNELGLRDLSSGEKIKFFNCFLNLSVLHGADMYVENTDAIIVIDEPENSLHPSSIKDLRKDLLKISKTNYVFIATHSPFMIDYEQDKDYNVHYYEVTNEENKGTKVRQLEKHESFNDDNLFEAAFGVNYMSQLIASNILVLEGVSDVVILKEAIKDKSIKLIPGKGKKVKQLIESFKDINVAGLFDCDNDGLQYKNNVNKLSESGYNVTGFIYKDFISTLSENSELEDLYDIKYVKKYLETLDNELELSNEGNKFKYEDILVNDNIDKLLDCYNSSCLEGDKDKYQKLIDGFEIKLNQRKPLKEVSDAIKTSLSNFFAEELSKDESEYDLSKIKRVAVGIDKYFSE